MLRRRWEDARAELEGLVARRDGARDASARTRAQNRIREALRAFTDELAGVTILDPACGSGNFLYVALNQLLDLEKPANLWGATEGGLPMGLPSVGPKQVMGLEVNASVLHPAWRFCISGRHVRIAIS